MSDFFSKQISVFINDKEHLLFVDGEVEISPSEIEYGWNHVPYELGGGFEVRSIDSVYVVRYGHSKTESEIPSYAKNVERWTNPNGEIVFWWEHHRQIELNDNLEQEIIGRMEELYADGSF